MLSKHPRVVVEEFLSMTSAGLEMFQTAWLRRILYARVSGRSAFGALVVMNAGGKDSVTTKNEKLVIGATATVTETSSGVSFPARIDTGAETCSLHVEKMQIDDKTARRLRNVGKTVRFLVKDNDGKTALGRSDHCRCRAREVVVA